MNLLQTKEKPVSYEAINYAPSLVKEENSAYISSVSDQSIKDPHVKLFRDLFIGREDVYAERWESKDGRSNYSPAKVHDWSKHTIDPKTKGKFAVSHANFCL